jgi:hypothetical protein
MQRPWRATNEPNHLQDALLTAEGVPVMHKNPLGDFILGTLGGALSTYFLSCAAWVLLTGRALSWGPSLPLEPASDTGAFFYLTVRLTQSLYHVGLACLVFLAFRFVQELLRGHSATQAFKEAATLPGACS